MNSDSRKYRAPPELIMPDDVADAAFAPPIPGRTHVFFANTQDRLFISKLPSYISGLKVVSTEFLSAGSVLAPVNDLTPSTSKSRMPPLEGAPDTTAAAAPQAAPASSPEALSQHDHKWEGLLGSADTCVALLTSESMADPILYFF